MTQNNYEEKSLRDAVFQATVNLADKKESFSEDEIKQGAVKLLTGKTRKKAKPALDPVQKDEFFSKALKESSM